MNAQQTQTQLNESLVLPVPTSPLNCPHYIIAKQQGLTDGVAVLNPTHTRLTARFSGTTLVSRYQKVKTNLDFTEARDSEWQWHQLDHMQVCT